MALAPVAMAGGLGRVLRWYLGDLITARVQGRSPLASVLAAGLGWCLGSL